MSSAVTARERSSRSALFLKQVFVRERVHQPGLTAGLGPHRLQCLGCERLAGLLRVLAQQRQRLLAREIAQPE